MFPAVKLQDPHMQVFTAVSKVYTGFLPSEKLLTLQKFVRPELTKS